MQTIAFDLETTGLYPIKDKIVEIGAVRFDNDKITEEFQTLVNPGVPIPQEVIAIHGITDQMVLNAPAERDALELFLKFIGDDIMLAHSASFDAGFIMASVALHKLKVPANLLIDTCELARTVLPGMANYKLPTLGKHFNLAQSGYHRALADAVAVAGLFRICRAKLPDQMTPIDIANYPNQGLKFRDFVFGEIELPPDKIVVRQAVEQGFDLEIEYRNSSGEVSQRVISPFNMYSFRGRCYIAAYCHNASEERQFRVDRIVSAQKTKNVHNRL
ncbi:MAG: WYL domain-containing protein [Planctomycetes bacterium]|nr:WYL domain-containing protein [Planctomycetota bacterium]